MYEIDKEIDFDFMVGKELIQFCVGLYQLVLNFSDGLSITVESRFRVRNISGSIIEGSVDCVEVLRDLMDLLGSRVDTVERCSNSELSVFFSNGYIFTLIDGNEDGESFTITCADREIIV